MGSLEKLNAKAQRKDDMKKYLTRHLVAISDVQVGRSYHTAGAKFYATPVDAEYLLGQGSVKEVKEAPAPKPVRAPSPRSNAPAVAPTPAPAPVPEPALAAQQQPKDDVGSAEAAGSDQSKSSEAIDG